MEWLNIKTGYSFKSVFGHVDEIIKVIKGPNCRFAGIADINSTFGHVAWSKACHDAGIKPIFGVQLTVCDRPKEKSRSPQFRRNLMTFIATSRQGVEEIYHLVDLAHSQFYHMPLLTYDQLNKTTLNLLVLSGLAPDFEKIKRDIHLQMSPDLPRALVYSNAFPRIACIDNWYPTKKDKIPYETFASNAYSYESKTSPMHILDDAEWLEIFPNHLDAIKNRNVLANICSGVELPRAPFISVGAHSGELLKADCFQGAKRKGQHKDKQAMARLDYELKLIENKGFEDYFLVVADLIKWAKTKMVVGPGRGSSAGSIVCYFLGITTVNPLDYGLLFERFIDINRTDLPDIDIDFQDDKREMVLGYLKEKYGVECVAQIGNVSKLKPKSAFNRAAKALRIDSHLISEFKESIEERPEGDKRERFAIKDAIKTTDLGRAFKKTFKNMVHVHKLEGHPSHSSIHAGGVLVCTEPVGNFCGINSRDPKKRVAMIDKRDAEELNLLKIDALGLKTLTVLAEVCEIIGKPYSWLEGIPLDDKKVFKMINKNDFTGIFQMEGDAFRGLAERMTVKTLEEMADLSALCRPGPLMAGSAEKYVKIKSGDRAPKYICNHKVIIEQTRETMGLIIYQEQIMAICKEFGQMSWPSVIKVRKMMGKSMGDEAFQAYKKEFMKGALSNKATKKEALEVWEAMENFGKYGFNKSHAIVYSVISYLTAYMKTYHLKEFAVGLLNNSNNTNSCVKLLRKLVETGVKYSPLDIHNSQKKWSIHKGVLLGGLLSVDGLGPQKANTVLKCRREGAELPEGIEISVQKLVSPFKFLYPGRDIYGEYYKKKKGKYGWSKATKIKNIKEDGEFLFIGKLIKKTIKNPGVSGAVSRSGKTIKSETYVSAVFEDDTGAVNAIISRKAFAKGLGEAFLKQSTEDLDWFHILGDYSTKGGYKTIFIRAIHRITKEI